MSITEESSHPLSSTPSSGNCYIYHKENSIQDIDVKESPEVTLEPDAAAVDEIVTFIGLGSIGKMSIGKNIDHISGMERFFLSYCRAPNNANTVMMALIV